jgi:predicted  nucleic acid-binding Zn-ribbon protein
MGPPPKGSREYKQYLSRQAARRRNATAARRKAAKQKLVASHVAAALKQQALKHAKELDALTRRSNRHFNAANSLKEKAKEVDFWKDFAEQTTKQNCTLNSKLQTANNKVKKLEQDLERAKSESEEASKWQCWYSRLRQKAPERLLALINRWGYSNPPPAPDRCWGGGQ